MHGSKWNRMRLIPGSRFAEAKLVRRRTLPVLSCTAWGLSCPAIYIAGGGLLPRLFTLTLPKQGSLFSVTLSVVPDLSPARPRILRGMLPDGVRTFLYAAKAQRSSVTGALNLRAVAADAISFGTGILHRSPR